ncbi:hypothetical protein EJB05_24773, partial [Eragrostis curvula]
MAEEYQAPPPRTSKRPRHDQPAPLLPDDVIVEQILTRVPAAAAARRAVRAAGAQQPEIAFFARRPAAAGSSATGFYSCKLKVTSQQEASAAACELVTVSGLREGDLVLSGTRPCHGLTLLYLPSTSEYHVCNLSTGEHVALPPCPWAKSEIPDGPYMLSSTGIGFDVAAGEHKVVRPYKDWTRQERCEVYGLRSGGWRPCAGQVPPHAAKGLDGRPLVFLDGCFYWHINTLGNFDGPEADFFSTPEPILSFAVDTEQFGWVPQPEERSGYSFLLAELDGFLCAVVDLRLTVKRYELWTLPAGSGSGALPPSWSLRCSISLAGLPPLIRDRMVRPFRMIPLASSFGGKILLATSWHEVFTYDPESNSFDWVFSVQEFMDAPREPHLLLNIALHEECITSVRHRPLADGDAGQLKMKIGKSTVARRQTPAHQRQNDFHITPQLVQMILGIATEQYNNMHD